MNTGNKLRRTWRRGDALVLLALSEIAAIREEKNKELDRGATEPLDRFAYILRSLKHPAEIELLRVIYGSRFVLVAAYASRSIRKAPRKVRQSRSTRSPQSRCARASRQRV